MSTATLPAPPKRKTVTVPAFTVGHVVMAEFPECEVELEPVTFENTGEVLKGTYRVFATPRSYAMAQPQEIGRIHKFGTGWTAELHYGDLYAKFTGDHFPTRTGKHTQTYAIAFLLATCAGIGQTAATFNLKYEGVSA